MSVEAPEFRTTPRQKESFEVTRVLRLNATPEEIFAGATECLRGTLVGNPRCVGCGGIAVYARDCGRRVKPGPQAATVERVGARR